MKTNCDYCKSEIDMFPCRFNKSSTHFCNKSCHRKYKNIVDNPSKYRDLSGENNPMWGSHPIAWNVGIRGEECHNWKGGIHSRKDGYIRINVGGERQLLHRYLLKDKLSEENVVHHIDGNPSNNLIENLEILDNQSNHARIHSIARWAKNSS